MIQQGKLTKTLKTIKDKQMKLTDIIKPFVPCKVIKTGFITYTWDGEFLWTSTGIKCVLANMFLFDTDFELTDWKTHAKSLGYMTKYIDGVLYFSWDINDYSAHWNFTLKIPEPKSPAEFDEIVRKLKSF